MGHLLECLGYPLVLVGGELTILLKLVELMAGRSAQVSDLHASILRLLANHFDHVSPALLSQGRKGESDDLAIVRRVDAEIRRTDRLLNGGHGPFVEWNDLQQSSLGDIEASE